MSKATVLSHERLEVKTAFALFTNYLIVRYNFSKVIAESLFKDTQYFRLLFDKTERTDGQIIYQAVKNDEPAGKALKDCQLVNLKLTLRHPDDDRIRAKYGLAGLRRHKLRRISEETCIQGGTLSQEDYAALLDVNRRTIIRDIAALRATGIEIVTRAHYTDQGRGISHKERIVKLFLQGFSLTEVANYSKHNLKNVQRYIYDFLRICLLYQENKSSLMISRLAKVSKALADSYINLFEHLQSDDLYREPLERRLLFYSSQLQLSSQKKRKSSDG